MTGLILKLGSIEDNQLTHLQSISYIYEILHFLLNICKFFCLFVLWFFWSLVVISVQLLKKRGFSCWSNILLFGV